MNNDISKDLLEQVTNAFEDKTSLRICAGNSKTFYGNPVEANIISTAKHTGIIEYQPSELVVTVRSGTLLSELETELKSNKQMLAFEPPQHSKNTTIGGTIACGLSGPRRVASGSARDFVLGTSIINGKAEKCSFGGQVMKNVAGYDAARLMCGAQGTLGLLLDISLKVLPLSELEVSVKIDIEDSLQNTIKNIRHWIKQGLPISASCLVKNKLYLRLSSTTSAVKHALNIIKATYNSEEIDNTFWLNIKNQTHDFFTKHDASETNKNQLWRLSSVNTLDIIKHADDTLIEWHGALCWLRLNHELHTLAAQHQANATRYPLHVAENKNNANIFQPLQPGVLKINQRLKQAFDPEKILNPSRLYSEL